MSAPQTFPKASKKNNHDVFTRGVHIVPRTFQLRSEGGPSVLLVSPTSSPIDQTRQHFVTQSSSPFMPTAGQLTGQPIGTSHSGTNTYGYRRIPFVHKLGGAHIQASIGNTNNICESLRLNLGK